MVSSRSLRKCRSRILQILAVVVCLFTLYTLFLVPKLQTEPEANSANMAEVLTGEINQQINLEDGIDPFTAYKKLNKKDWHDYEAMRRDSERNGLGEGGKPVEISINPQIKDMQDKLYRENGYDAYISDLIALNRSVKDIRHPECMNMKYIEKLPSVGVILPVHDEHNSTLLRSVYSIINRSPKEILKEIIIVDDASVKLFLKKPLEDYLKAVRLDHIVKIVRTQKREGLIRARQIGAQHATADVMVFMDAHSEANYNWLPPLIEPITLNYRTVVCPFVDVIDCNTYEYRAQDEGARGSFDWMFNYKRLPLTEDDKKDRTRPFKSPVMAGGYFAISRKWFWELGGYDDGLDIWGGEQYELSFKIWQCHGSLFDAPCSRVGHIYRCKYVPFPDPGIGDFVSRNYRRVAEVWMDEYAKVLYKHMPALRKVNVGDLSKQKAVRQRLKCKPFDWFMKEIAFDQDKFYPAVEPEDSAAGELRNVATNSCVDMQFRGTEQKFGLRTCNSDDPLVGGEQDFRLTFWHDVRSKQRAMCFDVSTSQSRAPVVIFACHGMKGNQQFKYLPDKQQLYHPISGLCMDCDEELGEIFMNTCSSQKKTQRWKWTKINPKLIAERNERIK